jgi:hypothetical protein
MFVQNYCVIVAILLTESEVTSEDESGDENEVVDAVSSDDSDGTVEYDDSMYAWSKEEVMVRSRKTFTGTPGRIEPIADIDTPLLYLNLFLTPDMKNNIVIETNRYAQQLLASGNLKRTSRMRKWVDITTDELMIYLAIIIYQGIVQKAEQDMYWTTKPLLETPYIRKLMSEKRFSVIEKCLHFIDNGNLPDAETAAERSFWKIKPFFDALINRFRTVYIPDQCIAVDESLMLWKGRLAMKQYIPMKRARFGLKSYELCESKTGYIWNSIVHIGTAMQLLESRDGLKSSRIVLSLIHDLLGKGYCLFTDNWYSSPALFKELSDNQTDAVGTVRLNRQNMPADLRRKITRGQVIACYMSEMMALKWKDKKDVSMLSTFHGNEMEIVQNFRGERAKPVSIVNYNHNMGGVDLAETVWRQFYLCSLLLSCHLEMHSPHRLVGVGTM